MTTDFKFVFFKQKTRMPATKRKNKSSTFYTYNPCWGKCQALKWWY